MMPFLTYAVTLLVCSFLSPGECKLVNLQLINVKPFWAVDSFYASVNFADISL